MRTLCSLERNIAPFIETHNGVIFSKSGVWNKFKEISKSDVIRNVKSSPYGADVDLDEKSNILYVTIPSESDMW